MADVHELIAQSGFIGPVPNATLRKFERFAELVRAEEREICARHLELRASGRSYSMVSENVEARKCAEAIRSYGAIRADAGEGK